MDGAVFGYAAHWSTRGRRDFSSAQTLEAQRYDVYIAAEHAASAARYLESATTDQQTTHRRFTSRNDWRQHVRLSEGADRHVSC